MIRTIEKIDSKVKISLLSHIDILLRENKIYSRLTTHLILCALATNSSTTTLPILLLDSVFSAIGAGELTP